MKLRRVMSTLGLLMTTGLMVMLAAQTVLAVLPVHPNWHPYWLPIKPMW